MTIVIKPNSYNQLQFLASSNINEVLYAGGKGGGKSFALLMDMLSYLNYPVELQKITKHLICRQSREQLAQLFEISKQLYLPFGATYDHTKMLIKFPSGMSIKFAYIEREQDLQQYQGHGYAYIALDEAGNLRSEDLWVGLMLSQRASGLISSDCVIPHGYYRARLTANPIGPGVPWIKRRFQIQNYPKGYTILKDQNGLTRMWIPSTLSDNVDLLRSTPMYKSTLDAIPNEKMRNALLHGDWDAYVGGEFFKVFSVENNVIKNDYGTITQIVNNADHIIISYDGATSPKGLYGIIIMAHLPRGVIIKDKFYPGNSYVIFDEIMENPINVRETANIIDYKFKEMVKLYGDQFNNKCCFVADPAIWATKGSDASCEAGNFRQYGIPFKKALNNRALGWGKMLMLMRGVDVEGEMLPQLYITDNCTKLLHQISIADYATHDINDLDTTLLDHLLDAARYGIMHIKDMH